jgi:hypothetical protein
MQIDIDASVFGLAGPSVDADPKLQRGSEQ